MKKYSFFFHFNKPASRAQKRNVLSIHYAGVCHLVHKIKIVGIDISSKDNKRQPHCTMVGKAHFLTVNESSDGTREGVLHNLY